MKSTQPLKFKAWHSVHRTMYDIVQLHAGFPDIVSSRASESGNVVTRLLSEADRPYLTVVQATSYKSTDGGLVYERDVILSVRGEDEGRSGVVIFYKGVYAVSDPSIEDPESTDGWWALDEFMERNAVTVTDSSLFWE